MTNTIKALSQEQINFFIQNGYIKLPGSFSQDVAAEWIEDVWIRLGMDPKDQNTWNRERTHMPWNRSGKVEKIAPQVWATIGELLGGHDRVQTGIKPNGNRGDQWGDSLIVNLGSEDLVGKPPCHPRELKNWHCDGDFFLHFLDSPEQALLVVPIFTSIMPNGGGTIMSPDSIPLIANHLADHPEGVLPMAFGFQDMAQKCNTFIELTGEPGDVYLMHPLMMHSASQNVLRHVRIITNPPVSLREPFKFKRESVADFSIVELTTLRALGVDPRVGSDFQPTVPRQAIVPDRIKFQQEWKRAEAERMKAAKKA